MDEVVGTRATCANCGLPAPSGQRFCCYGCELADSVRQEAREDHGHRYNTLCFVAILSMIVMMLSLFLYAEDVFGVKDEPEMAWMRAGYRWASLVLSVPVMALAGWPLARRAFASWRSMDALIALGAFAAFALSCAAVLRGDSAVYFETATTAIVLATLGRYLEATARTRASGSLGPLIEVSRGTAHLCEGGRTRPIAVSQIEPGMSIEVAAEEVVPVDLRLESAAGEVDLAVITGESRAVAVARGGVVPAGAVASGRSLRGVALASARDSALERLASLARELSASKARGLAYADRFAAALAPVASLVALGVCAHAMANGAAGEGVARGLAVLLAACPCAYAIASPLVYWLLLRGALSRGVLIRSAEALEALAAVDAVAFDKTGTLTEPQPVVTQATYAPSTSAGEVLPLVRALEDGCAHPVARALLAYARAVPAAPLADRKLVPGRGVEGVDQQGRALTLGLGVGGDPELARDGHLLARFALAEALRPEARAAVHQLREDGIEMLVLSGDDVSRVDAVGAALAIPARARLSPQEKVERLARLGVHAAMVGDGVNDAPALAGRLTSFTLGGGASLAKGVAQVTLLTPDLTLVPWTLAHARDGLALVRRLLISATVYNLVFVALAATGALRPVWAGLSMLTSSLLSLAFASRAGGLADAAEPAATGASGGPACPATGGTERAC